MQILRQSHHDTALDRGFTIIELLIVIVVIGILATVAIVGFSGIPERARWSAKLSLAANISDSMEAAATKQSATYPPSTGALSGVSGVNNTYVVYQDPGYVQALIDNDTGNFVYCGKAEIKGKLCVMSNGTMYTIFAFNDVKKCWVNATAMADFEKMWYSDSFLDQAEFNAPEIQNNPEIRGYYEDRLTPDGIVARLDAANCQDDGFGTDGYPYYGPGARSYIFPFSCGTLWPRIINGFFGGDTCG